MSSSYRRKWFVPMADSRLAIARLPYPFLATTLLAIAINLFAAYPAVAEPPAALKDFRPDRLVRFATRAEAEQRRERLIRFIWPDGLPTRAATVSVESPQTAEQRLALLAGLLRGLDATNTEQLYALDTVLPRYDFSTRLYLLAPVDSRKQKPQLFVIHQGHQGGLGDVYETYSGFLERLVERLKPGRWQVHSDRTHQTHSISPAALNKVILPVLTQSSP
jgi:hypothetical protein